MHTTFFSSTLFYNIHVRSTSTSTSLSFCIYTLYFPCSFFCLNWKLFINEIGRHFTEILHLQLYCFILLWSENAFYINMYSKISFWITASFTFSMKAKKLVLLQKQNNLSVNALWWNKFYNLSKELWNFWSKSLFYCFWAWKHSCLWCSNFCEFCDKNSNIRK